jgi:hypothetical protein
MSVTIDLPPDLEKSVRQQAAQSGQEVSAFVLQAVREKLARARPFGEVCAPFAEAVAATGISDEEFDRFFEEARDEVWRRSKARPHEASLVSRDKDLLDQMNDEGFRQRYPDLTILDPAAFLQAMAGQGQRESPGEQETQQPPARRPGQQSGATGSEEQNAGSGPA